MGTGANQHGGPGAPPKKRMQASEPSPHVIFLGLDPDFTESDVRSIYALHSLYSNTFFCHKKASSIPGLPALQCRDSHNHKRKIIRHLTNLLFLLVELSIDVLRLFGFFKGTSKGFGFAQFASTEHARAFVDPLFPFIQVPPPASHGATSASAFYKALETGAPHNGRRVKIDYSQSVSPQEKGRQRGNQNDGTRDIGNSQGPVLLFRGLDPLSGPQAIHQAMRGSMGPSVEGGKGMRRIIQIKDKVTLASFGFAFVEFVDVQVGLWSSQYNKSLNDNSFSVSCDGTCCYHVPAASPQWVPDLRCACGGILCSGRIFSACGPHDER